MNRRSFLAAGVGVLGVQAARAGMTPWMGMEAVDGVNGPPVGLLESTFGPMAGSLLPAAEWRPLPKAEDRAGWLAVPQDVREDLVRQADAVNNDAWPIMLATEELEFKRNGNRSRFEAITFGRRGRLSDLVLGECVAGEGKYLDQIANGTWLICEESFWGVPAHLGAQKAGVGLADEAEPIIELFGAETAATMAWVVYLLGEKLGSVSERLAPRVQMETKRRILDVYFERSDFGWMGSKGGHVNNWNPWINSNVLTATMVLEPDAARRAQLVAKICKSVDVFLAEYSPDAGCEEGPNYWSRSAASFFDCCTTLVSAHGGKGTGVLTHPFTRAMGQYIADVHIAKNLYVNYGDAHVDSAPEPELVYAYGKASGNTMLAEFGAFDAAWRGSAAGGAALRGAFLNGGGGLGSLSRGLTKVFVAAEVRTAAKHDALVRDAWYPRLDLMTAREKEGSSEGFYVALQAASNGRSHAHNDSGSFIVFQDGEPVFIDVGVEAYTAKTFSKDRYEIWTMQSAFHNLPTIGGVMQHEGNAYKASEARYEKNGALTSVRANLATAYPKEAGVTRWMRTVALDRTARRVEIEEEFALAKAVAVELSLMTAREPVLADGSVKVGGAVLKFDGAVLRATSEKIVLTDGSLRHCWGDAVWRVKLTSKGAVARGLWKMTLNAA